MVSGRIPAPSYRTVYEEGRSVANRYLVMYYRAGESSVKLGVSVSRRLGKAFLRNKVKRRIKEAFRHLIPSIRSGGDFVFVARHRAAEAQYKEIFDAMKDLLKRMELL